MSFTDKVFRQCVGNPLNTSVLGIHATLIAKQNIHLDKFLQLYLLVNPIENSNTK